MAPAGKRPIKHEHANTDHSQQHRATLIGTTPGNQPTRPAGTTPQETEEHPQPRLELNKIKRGEMDGYIQLSPRDLPLGNDRHHC